MTPAEQIRHAADQVLGIKDPADRARAIGEVLALCPDLAAELRAGRQQAVLELRTVQQMSHADVAAILGVSRARAQQIAEGRHTGKRKEEVPVEEPAPVE